MNALRTIRLVAATLLVLSAACAPRMPVLPAPAPVAKPDGSCKPTLGDELPRFEIRRLPTDSVEILRGYLRSRRWPDAIRTYFHNYQGRLAAWVVYVEADGTVHQGIVSEGCERTALQEQRYVWAMVFMDRQLRGQGSDTMDFRFSRRVVAYQRDPKLVILVKGLGKVIGIDVPKEPELADSTRALRLDSASSDQKKQLYVAFGRFGLIENTQVQLSLTPEPKKHFADPEKGPPTRLLHVYTNFGNGRKNSLELGVLIAGTYGPRIRAYGDDLQLKSESSRGDANAYLTAIVNLPSLWFRPPWKRPWQLASVGAFGGTNLARGSLGDELVAGLAVGRVVGELGLAVGADWIVQQTIVNGRIVRQRQPRFLAGFDFRF